MLGGFLNCIILSIDPGSSGFGVAAWEAKNFKSSKKYPLAVAAYSYSNKDWIENVHKSVDDLRRFVGYDNLVTTVYCEQPQFFSGTAGGYATAASGALIKLAFSAGALCNYYPVPTIMVPIIKWKGQLPKDVVIDRIVKILPNLKGVSSHGWDAVGIGLYAKGVTL